MKQLIARLRELESMYPTTSDRVGMGALVETWEAVPQLLDRLEKLEAVAKHSQAVVIANADAVHGDADIHQACWGLKNALAALKEKE